MPRSARFCPTTMDEVLDRLPDGAARLPSGAVLLDGAHRIGRESRLGDNVFDRELTSADAFLAAIGAHTQDLRISGRLLTVYARAWDGHMVGGAPSGIAVRRGLNGARDATVHRISTRTRLVRWQDGSINLHHHGRLLPLSWCVPGRTELSPTGALITRRTAVRSGRHALAHASASEDAAPDTGAARDAAWFVEHGAAWTRLAAAAWSLAPPRLAHDTSGVLTPWWLETSGWDTSNGPAIEAGILHALDAAGFPFQPDLNIVVQGGSGDLDGPIGQGRRRAATITVMNTLPSSGQEVAVARAIEAFPALLRVLRSNHLFVQRHRAAAHQGRQVLSTRGKEPLWGVRLGAMSAHARMAGLHRLHALAEALP